MSAIAYFYNGTTKGDAINAPYSESSFANVLDTMFSSKTGHVIPNYLDKLEITFSAGQTIVVNSGAAFIDGVFFKKPVSELVVLENNTSGKPRIDRVVVRVDWNTNITEIAVKSGPPTNVPAPTALLQSTGDVYEISLARIFIPDSFTGFDATYIYDERSFLQNADTENDYTTENVMHNSELLSLNNTGVGSAVPAMWEESGAGTLTSTTDTRFDEMSRGEVYHATAFPVDKFMTTTVRVARVDTSDITIRFLLEVTEGAIDVSVKNTDAVVLHIEPNAGPRDYIFRVPYTNAEQVVKLGFKGSETTNAFKLGQITISYGFIPAPYAQKHEVILFGAPLNDSDYDYTGDEIERIGQTYPFTRVPRSTLIKTYVRDDASAGLDVSHVSVTKTGLTNDTVRTEVGRIASTASRWNQGWLNGFSYDVLVTAAGNSWIDLDFMGIST